jgi:hypothetical protein
MEVSDFNTFNRYFPYSIYLVMLDRGERICLHCTLNNSKIIIVQVTVIKTTQRNNGLKYRIFRRILTCLVEL